MILDPKKYNELAYFPRDSFRWIFRRQSRVQATT